MNAFKKNLDNFGHAQSGNVAIIFSLALVLILGAAGAGLDYASFNDQRTRLQEAADSGALYGATTLGRGGKHAESRAANVAKSTAESALSGNISSASVAVNVNSAAETVEVTLTMPGKRLLSGLLMNSDPTLVRAATAKVAEKQIACIIALSPTAPAALNGNGNAVLQGTNCGIEVASTDLNAMTNSGTISASSICVAGGYSGSGYTPAPQASCPASGDPFQSTLIPTPGACTDANLSINSDQSLTEGVYCGGLQVSGGATVTLSPGTYHIVDGALKITGGGSIIGTEVVFVLSGTATMDIAGSGTVSTTPPGNGDLAGYSIVQDRLAPLGGKNKITGEGQFEFPGIVYLPRSDLDVAGRATGNTFTPTYAAIVADTIKISGSGELNATADTSNFSKKDSTSLTNVCATLIK